MFVPYGFGVGDFVAVGTLAWNVYKTCKAAPGSFAIISVEVLSLHAVLKECEETVFTRPISPERLERLVVIKDGFDKVLGDLQSLVDKYEGLSTQSKRTWDRMKWGNEDIAEIRARLISNISLLTAYISTSQSSVEAKLDKFIEEFRQGKREGSIVSLQTIDSLSADDRKIWRSIRKELEAIGIDLAAFEANRNFILGWLARAIETGAFDEQNTPDAVEENSDSDEQESWYNEEFDDRSSGPQNAQSDTESPDEVPENHSPTLHMSPKSAHGVNDNNSKPAQTLDHLIVSRPRVQKKRASRAAVFIAAITRPKENFQAAVGKDEVSKALKILQDQASFQLLGPSTLGWALWVSCKRGDHVLASELVARGADVNWTGGKRTPLWHSVANRSLTIVRLLLENGADVNYIDPAGFIFLNEAPEFASRAALKRNDIEILRLLLSFGADVHARYKLWGTITTTYHSLRKYDYRDFNLVQEATLLGAFACIRVLIENGADIDAVSPDHGTALMLALTERQKDAAQFLLTEGADPHFKTASHEAYRRKNKIPYWSEYRSPIEAAILSGSPSMTSLLLDRGIVPDNSALSYAENLISGGHYDVSDEPEAILKLLQDARKARGY